MRRAYFVYVVVAERVYDYSMQRGLVFHSKELEIELELMWLTKHHDDHKVRLSGLSDEIDPEKVKFYLSALTNNVVTDLFFDQTQTKAVAVFQNSIGMIANVSPMYFLCCSSFAHNMYRYCYKLSPTVEDA